MHHSLAQFSVNYNQTQKSQLKYGIKYDLYKILLENKNPIREF